MEKFVRIIIIFLTPFLFPQGEMLTPSPLGEGWEGG